MEAKKTALRMLGAININVSYKSEEVITKFYCGLLATRKGTKRATKMVKRIKDLAYEERLKELVMFSLRYRRLRGDLIEVFKFVRDQQHGY